MTDKRRSRKKYLKSYRTENKKKISIYLKKWKEKNKDKVKVHNRRYYLGHKKLFAYKPKK